MNRFRSLILGVVLVLAGIVPAHAQTTLNSTTTTAAVTATQQIIPLASVTNVSAGTRAGLGDILVMDREGLEVMSVDTTALTATVKRGAYGTAAAHVSGVVVWTGQKQRFYQNQVVGSCTAVNEQYLPHIVLPGANSTLGGDIYDCKDGEWVRYRLEGYRDFSMGRSDGATTYTTSGAITVKPGVVLLGCSGACAMTIANPTVEQNGMMLIIIASTAQAHTVTYTAGFDGGTTARDVATYGGAIGDYMQIIAVNGVWYRVGIGVGAFGNVTLG